MGLIGMVSLGGWMGWASSVGSASMVGLVISMALAAPVALVDSNLGTPAEGKVVALVNSNVASLA